MKQTPIIHVVEKRKGQCERVLLSFSLFYNVDNWSLLH
uniref:Uncharacterized protein n=1 Tax=Arundo donax TaxID=35708 RepID=A0A0A9F711_ARUDO